RPVAWAVPRSGRIDVVNVGVYGDGCRTGVHNPFGHRDVVPGIVGGELWAAKLPLHPARLQHSDSPRDIRLTIALSLDIGSCDRGALARNGPQVNPEGSPHHALKWKLVDRQSVLDEVVRRVDVGPEMCP